jgi:hypothetical protein
MKLRTQERKHHQQPQLPQPLCRYTLGRETPRRMERKRRRRRRRRKSRRKGRGRSTVCI